MINNQHFFELITKKNIKVHSFAVSLNYVFNWLVFCWLNAEVDMDREVRLERFELKYIIPYSMVKPIINYIQIYCDQDPFSKMKDDGFYTVNSLYLDSKTFRLLQRKKDKVSNRFNLRVRSYEDGSKPPYFFEVKCKKGAIVDKLRSRVDVENWASYFDYKKDISQLKSGSDEHLNTFFRHAISYQAEPKILTQYDRLAYFSTIDDYARVTFDKNLRFQHVSDYIVTPDPAKMCNYDVGSAFGGETSSVVLELKSHRNVPIWMLDLIRFFGLNQRSFSKYERSLEESLFADITDFRAKVPAPLFA